MTRHLGTIFLRQAVRPARRHPVLALLNVASVALGVCVFLAVMTANQSANRSFRAGVEMLAGRADLEVRGGVDDRLLEAFASVPGVRAVTPVVQGVLTLPGHPGEYLRLLGVDPFSNGPFQTFRMKAPDGADLDIEAWLGQERAVALSREMAQRLGVEGGGFLEVAVDGRVEQLQVAFVVEPDDPEAPVDIRTATMDTGWAQELLGKRGRADPVLVQLADGADPSAVSSALQALVPADVAVAPPSRRSGQVRQMLASFQLNLTALSLVSLMVGMFLIHNTVAASVVRRRREIGILRAVGTSPGEIRSLFLGEALLFGVPGVLLGLLAAIPLASLLTGAVARTISSLYVLVSIERLEFSVWQVLAAAAAGLFSVVAAAWLPAREATRIDVTRALHLGTAMEEATTAPRRWLVAGVLQLAAAGLLAVLALQTGPPVLGFASAFFVLTGFACLVPEATTLLVRGAVPLAERLRGTAWRLALRNLVRALHRNAMTTAALLAAVAMTVGVSVMIHSFRASVNEWVGRTIQADLFVTLAANEVAGFQGTLPSGVLAWWREQPGVRGVDTFFERKVRMGEEEVFLAVVEGRMRGDLLFTGGGSAAKQARLDQPNWVAVSESFARRHGVAENSVLRLLAPGGPVDLRVSGVYSDYTRDQGVILIQRANYLRHWPEAGVHSLAVHLEDPAVAAELERRFREAWGQAGVFAVYSNASLRGRILEIFDQTFAVTQVLRTISVLVAVLGVSLTLTILVAEREREVGILRASGASAGQVARAFVAESALLGGLGGLLGVAAGACLAMVLTWVINRAFFGWTVQLAYPWEVLALTPLWMMAVAALAGWWPSRRAALIPPAAVLRSE